jgi:hypothetical protein
MLFSQFVSSSCFMVTDNNNVLCSRPSRLANVSQLTLRLASTSHEPPILLIDWSQLTAASQSQSYFTTGCLLPISSSWPSWHQSHDQRLFSQLNSCDNSHYVTSALKKRRVCLYEYSYAWSFVKHTFEPNDRGRGGEIITC